MISTASALALDEMPLESFYAPEPLPLPALERGQVLFRTLGTAEIHIGGGGVIAPGAERMFSLLAVVGMSHEHVIARESLMEIVWPGMDDASARHSLRQHVYKLRQLGVEIESSRASVRLLRSTFLPCFALDRTALLFDRDVLKGQEPFGHLFAGWLPSYDVLRSWVEQQRELYHADVRRILVPELRRLRDRGEWEEAERWARTVLEFDPFNEDATLIVAEAVAMLGSRVSASSLLESYVRETGVGGTDLGRRVEKAQQRIERAVRLSHDEAATPRLVGRDAELQRLDALTLSAMQGEPRIVRLLGPAGIGKTELAYEVTRRAVILGFARCLVRVSRPVGQVAHGTLSRLARDLLSLPGALGCRPENLQLLRQFAGVENASAVVDEIVSSNPDPFSECMAELISCVAEERPLLVFVDDLHYADRLSLDHLERLCDLLQGARVLLLLTERTQTAVTHEEGRSDSRNYEMILKPLSVPAAAELASLVRTRTGRSLTKELAHRVAVSTDRVPLQVVIHSREQLNHGLTSSPSDELLATLRRQLSRLSPPARTMLSCLALLGGSASASEVEFILDFTLLDRISANRELLDCGLIEEVADGRIQCHDEVTNAAVESVQAAQLRLLRRQIATRLALQLRQRFDAEQAVTALRIALESGDNALFVSLCIRHARAIADAGFITGSLRFLEIARTMVRTKRDGAAILSLLAFTAHRASNWRLVLKSTGDLRKIREASKLPNPELALAELEANLRSELLHRGRENAQLALEFAKDVRLSADLRTRAVRLAVVSASDLFESDLAISAYQALLGIDNLDLSVMDPKIEPYMQYHALFGDLFAALDLAKRMNHLRRARTLSEFEGRILCNSCFVLRLSGETKLATEWLMDTFHSKALEENPGRRAFAAWQLSLIAADENHVRSACDWAKTFEHIAVNELEGESEAWVTLHRLRIELLQHGEVRSVATALERIEMEGLTPSRALLYAVGLALSSSELRSDSERVEPLLARAVRYVRDCGSYGGQDLLASAVAVTLESKGAFSLARELSIDYVANHRRELSSPANAFLGASAPLQAEIRETFERRLEAAISLNKRRQRDARSES